MRINVLTPPAAEIKDIIGVFENGTVTFAPGKELTVEQFERVFGFAHYKLIQVIQPLGPCFELMTGKKNLLVKKAEIFAWVMP